MVIVGVDEVGRGCLAGPLVVGAVILNEPIAGLADSKLLTRAQRQSLDVIVRRQAVAYGLGWVSPAEIDRLGLTRAEALAIRRALKDLGDAVYDAVLIDGSLRFIGKTYRRRPVVAQAKADASVPAVSAASILAKVARDAYMIDLAKQYPAYGFEKHVGYGTSLHRSRLKLHGVSRHHRRSYQPIQLLLQEAI